MLLLTGVFIIRDHFEVGQSTTASCRSDTPATRIEWLSTSNREELIESALSTQELNLVFTLVNDSIHNEVYTCRVTREGGMIAIQNFTVYVYGKIHCCNVLVLEVINSFPSSVPSDAVRASVRRSGTARAGMMYSLNCTVSKTVAGLINYPTATWTIGGVAVANGNDITVSSTSDDMSTTSTLTFDPLRTSHEGIYTCGGALTSPALDTPLMPTVVEYHNVQSNITTINVYMHGILRECVHVYNSVSPAKCHCCIRYFTLS